MLYWLKQGLVHSRPQIAQLLHRSESTITRWLNAYRQGGLKQLLAVKTPPGAARMIPPAVMAQLQERLQDPSGFDSYKAIVQWLRQAHQLEVAYPTVHRIVRYELGAKLKVPRPRHQQQAPEATEDFKKNSLSSSKSCQRSLVPASGCATFVKTRVAGDCSPSQDGE